MECTVQKKKGRASKAVELTIRICHSVRPIDPSDLVRTQKNPGCCYVMTCSGLERYTSVCTRPQYPHYMVPPEISLVGNIDQDEGFLFFFPGSFSVCWAINDTRCCSRAVVGSSLLKSFAALIFF